MTTTSVDESISVTVSEPPVHATGGVLPITLARLSGEFLDFVNMLADTDPSDAAAIARNSGADRFHLSANASAALDEVLRSRR